MSETTYNPDKFDPKAAPYVQGELESVVEFERAINSIKGVRHTEDEYVVPLHRAATELPEIVELNTSVRNWEMLISYLEGKDLIRPSDDPLGLFSDPVKRNKAEKRAERRVRKVFSQLLNDIAEKEQNPSAVIEFARQQIAKLQKAAHSMRAN